MRLQNALPHLLISSVVTCVLLYLVFREQTLTQFFALLREIDLREFGVYLFLSLVGVGFRALRYKWLLKELISVDETALRRAPSQIPGTWNLVVLTLIRNLLVDLIPARVGELGYVYVLKRMGVAVITGVSTFGMCIALDLIALPLLLLFVVAFSFAAHPAGLGAAQGTIPIATSQGNLLTIILLLVVVLLVGVLAVRFMDRILHWVSSLIKPPHNQENGRQENGRQENGRKLSSRRIRASGFVSELALDFLRLKRSRSLVKLLSCTLLLRVAKYGSLYFLLLSVVEKWQLGFHQIQPLLTFIAFISAEASASLPFSGLLGFGAYEGMWNVAFSLSTVKIPESTAVIFAVHLITQMVGYAFGLLGVTIFGLNEFSKTLRDKRQLAPQPPK